ncbi:CTP synthase [Gossypium arboreum]|uniref:CTP synthase n=1 Tax=Gossypium arboreum TaxID=29729 RepID=A0A0B0MMT6_GOSAR|nr:CTP synthase [Gossypium arboreum]
MPYYAMKGQLILWIVRSTLRVGIKKSELVELVQVRDIYEASKLVELVRVNYGCEHPNSLNWFKFIMDAIHVIGFRAMVLCVLLLASVDRLARGWRSLEAASHYQITIFGIMKHLLEF